MGIYKSQISDPKYFLSQKNNDDLAELQATVRGFFKPANEYEKLIDAPTEALKKIVPKILDHSEHPMCRFPARFKFLRDNLMVRENFWNQLPKVNCVYQNIFFEAIQAHSVSFVFSSYYADSPGSAFGHTFFRINKKREMNTFERQELLDYGIGYAANITIDNPIMYTFLGLTGGFTGSWVNVPYYFKVREYNDFESRDLWSYDLNLTQDEVYLLTAHLWEVGAHHYTYYFFTQNCAYHMLTVLEAAAPRLQLSDKVPFLYVIPSDTIKVISESEGLVKSISYRPSIRQVFNKRFFLLENHLKTQFIKYADTGDLNYLNSDLNDIDRAMLYDVAIDLFDLRYSHLATFKNNKPSIEKEKLLNDRAKLSSVFPELKHELSEKLNPAISHGSSRFGFSFLENEKFTKIGLNYRFALHDLLDDQTGLPNYSMLEFVNLKFNLERNDQDNQTRFKLNEFNLFDVANFNPSSFIEKKQSWAGSIGVERNTRFCQSDKHNCYQFGGKFKYGFAFENKLNSQSVLYWTMLTTNLRYSEDLRIGKYLISIGSELGALVRFSDSHALLGFLKHEGQFNYPPFTQLNFEYRCTLNKNNQIGLRSVDNLIESFVYFNF